MPKKHYGKIRRYRSSFYRSRIYWVRRAALVLATLGALFAIGWFIGPTVVDFGTRTWYSLKNGGSKGPVTSAPELVASQPEQPAEPTPTPTPAPAQVDTRGSWGFLPISDLAEDETVRAAARRLKEEGAVYAVVTLKDSQGYLYYASAQALAADGIAATTVDAAAAARVLKEEGLIPVANLYMYQDPLAPYADSGRTAGIHYEDTQYYWLDAAAEDGGRPWLNPYSDLAFEYLDGLVNEVTALGYDHLLLSGVQYPNGASARCGYGETGGVSQPDQLKAVIGRWQEKAQEEGLVFWFEYSLPMAAAGGETGSPQLGGSTLADMGVENLMITLPEGSETDPAPLLERARANSTAAAYRVVRSGSTAAFDKG